MRRIEGLAVLDGIIIDVRSPPTPAAVLPPAAPAIAALRSEPETTSPAPAAKPANLVAGTLALTRALWLEDTYLFHTDARVLAVVPSADGSGWAVALDQTCFHPQGGGQPADTGVLQPSDTGAPFAVSTMVRLDKASGVVWHEGPGGADPPLAVGARVACAIDAARRERSARLHSAGHLLDAAMTAAGCALVPAKGYHFSPGSYVEYTGKLGAAEREKLLPRLTAELDRLVAQAAPTRVWQDESGLRMVDVGGAVCPCGGTHVRSAADIGKVSVDGIKVKGNVTRVSYSLV
jgi:Ser-tRNA(Ala) deacylase AlaX